MLVARVRTSSHMSREMVCSCERALAGAALKQPLGLVCIGDRWLVVRLCRRRLHNGNVTVWSRTKSTSELGSGDESGEKFVGCGEQKCGIGGRDEMIAAEARRCLG